MKNFDDEYEKKKLQQVVAETKEVAPSLIEKLRSQTENCQSALDLASYLGDLCETAPTDFFRNPLISHISGGLREFNAAAQKQCVQITEGSNLAYITHSSTTTTATTVMAFSPPDDPSGLLSFPLKRLLHRGADVASVQESMKLLGLDIAHGDSRSPVEQVRTAEEALKRPFANEGYATAVLIPLRESIQGTIEELLRRRKTTEKTSGWVKKVTSIAQHCGKVGLSTQHVCRVAETTHTVIDQLSGSKHLQIDRDRITLFFDQGIFLLQDIVSLVDVHKLRPVNRK
jgi:hypothetical protein